MQPLDFGPTEPSTAHVSPGLLACAEAAEAAHVAATRALQTCEPWERPYLGELALAAGRIRSRVWARLLHST